MPLTPEEALREALEPWPMAALDADRVISRLEPRGYRLTPIEINEAAVEKAARQDCERSIWACQKGGRCKTKCEHLDSEDVALARRHIVAYLEGAK